MDVDQGLKREDLIAEDLKGCLQLLDPGLMGSHRRFNLLNRLKNIVNLVLHG